MYKTIAKVIPFFVLPIFPQWLYAQNEATYDPLTQLLAVPQVMINGDMLRTPYAINLRYLGGNSCEVVSVDIHECNNYTPTAAGGTFSGSWEINERHEYTITIPDDPAGGYVRATLETTSEKAIPWMNIDTFPPEAGAILSGSAGDEVGDRKIEDVFEVSPGQTYHFEVYPWFNGTPPMAYTLKWEFISRVDCYEPNDFHERDQGHLNSKRIPLNQVIQAFAIAGHDPVLITDKRVDWYRIELNQQTSIKLEQLQSPSNILLKNLIFTEELQSVNLGTPNLIQGESESTPGRLLEYNSVTLNPGTYYIKVIPEIDFRDDAVRLTDDKPFSDHFDKPYKFQLVTVP